MCFFLCAPVLTEHSTAVPTSTTSSTPPVLLLASLSRGQTDKQRQVDTSCDDITLHDPVRPWHIVPGWGGHVILCNSSVSGWPCCLPVTVTTSGLSATACIVLYTIGLPSHSLIYTPFSARNRTFFFLCPVRPYPRPFYVILRCSRRG